MFAPNVLKALTSAVRINGTAYNRWPGDEEDMCQQNEEEGGYRFTLFVYFEPHRQPPLPDISTDVEFIFWDELEEDASRG